MGVGALGAAAAAVPALADTMYTDPATGQPYVTSSAPGYNSGPFDVVTMPVRTAAWGVLTPANGGVGPATGTLIPVNPHCFVQTDFNGKRTAMCGP